MTVLPEHLPRPIYSAAQVRELDRAAIERLGVSGYELMCRAGAAALGVVRRHWPAAQRLTIVCGAGNNGGDGLVLARLAVHAGLAVRVLFVVPAERLRGEASRAALEARAAGVPLEPFGQHGIEPCDVIVDALLGTGLTRPVADAFRAAIDAINGADKPVLALDVPSGLDADTGWPRAVAVHATVTLTFVGLKQGLFLGAAVDYCGAVEFAALDLPADLGAALMPALWRLGATELTQALPRRVRSAHKGSHGRLLLVGGERGMGGAIRLAAEAALRTGAGLVYVATHPDNVSLVLAGRPEIICRAVSSVGDLEPMLTRVDAVVLGPGLGQSDWARALWRRVLAADLPVVLDADGLNLLALEPAARARSVLTPHAGEAARLLGLSSADAVQRDRLGALAELVRRYGASVVLKGAHSLVAHPGAAVPFVCNRGNPGMATAGMGDVLAGVIGSLVVQTGDLELATRAAVLLHALAGDAAAQAGERGMLAGDLLAQLRQWANPS